MKLLILGDIMGASGRKALSEKLPDIIKLNKIREIENLNKNPDVGVICIEGARFVYPTNKFLNEIMKISDGLEVLGGLFPQATEGF